MRSLQRPETRKAATNCKNKAQGVLNCSAILSSWCDDRAMTAVELFLAIIVSSTLLLLTAFVLMALMMAPMFA